MSTIKNILPDLLQKNQPNLFFLSWFDILDTFEFLLHRIYLIILNNISQMSVTLPFVCVLLFSWHFSTFATFLGFNNGGERKLTCWGSFPSNTNNLADLRASGIQLSLHLMSKRERQMDFRLNKSDRKKLLSVRSHWHPAVRLADGPLRSQAAWGTERDTAAGGRSTAGRWRSSTGPDESGSQIGEYVQLTTHQYS